MDVYLDNNFYDQKKKKPASHCKSLGNKIAAEKSWETRIPSSGVHLELIIQCNAPSSEPLDYVDVFKCDAYASFLVFTPLTLAMGSLRCGGFTGHKGNSEQLAEI